MNEVPAGRSAPLVDALAAVRSSYVGQTRERDASGVVRQKWRRRNESVPANVVALCAACHAKIHFAVKAVRELESP